MSNKINVLELEIAKPHTIKKFEVIEKYVESWIHKLLQLKQCSGIVFIDCMCNSGLYQTEDGKLEYGTPIRITKLINKEMGRMDYLGKRAWIYLNDLEESKIEQLNDNLPQPRNNVHLNLSHGDGNDLLKRIGSQLKADSSLSYLLIYDPYQATLDWTALKPFLNYWGEVVINHMLCDSTRAISQAKSQQAVEKYEQTYMTSISELVKSECRREDYENRIEEIILELRQTRRKYYIASCPFFNRRNALVYNLIHCTSNIEGFKLFKKSVWQTFEGKSSGKNTHGLDEQLSFDLENMDIFTTTTVDDCYNLRDIAKYLHNTFRGQQNVPLSKVWAALDEHPVFPSDLSRSEIKKILKDSFYDNVGKQSISFRS